MNKEQLWGWIFQFNPYIQKYMATTRENYHELSNGDKGNVLYAETMSILEKLILEKQGVVEN